MQWAAGIAAAGVVGVGLGVGGDMILKPAKAAVSTMTETATETSTVSSTVIKSPTSSSTTTSTSTASSNTLYPMTVTDAAGRTVTIPSEPMRVVTLHPIATQNVWMIAPQKMVNIDRVFNNGLSTFLAPPASLQLLESLPVTGVYFDPPNEEQIASLQPDLIVSLIGDTYVDTYQTLYNCPAILCNKESLEAYEEGFTLCGQVLNNPTRGEQLSAFWDATLDSITALTSTIPEANQLKVYYASHENALYTAGTQTDFGSELALAGTIGYTSANPGAGIAPTNEEGTVSLEQLVLWNPDVIITSALSVQQQIVGSAQWANIAAVQNNRVYNDPTYFDMDGDTALIGLLWMANIVYPNVVTLNIDQIAEQYYQLFNGYSITPAQLQIGATNGTTTSTSTTATSA